MSGSSPLADDVTRSTGTGAVFSALRGFTSPLMRSSRALLVGPRFEASEAAALYGELIVFPRASVSVVTDGRPWKYPGRVKFCPISAEPINWPFLVSRLPFACQGNSICDRPVIPRG